jgi:hypothetical protein
MDRNQLLNDPEAALRYGLDGKQAQIWTAMPGIVSAVDLSMNTVAVQPSIQGVQTNPNGSTQYVNLPLLVDCPIVFPSAGGFSLTLPIKAGDEVLVVIASRCIDAWWQSGGIGVPMELRMHDLSDGFVIPGPKSLPNVIGGISSSNAQLRNDAGTVFLEITPSGQINATAPAGMTFTTPTLVVTGDVIATGISLVTHIHSGVATGPHDTGPPV